jgi:hypothetical protein
MRFLLLFLATVSVAFPQQAPIAQSRKDVPFAPLPAKLQTAKKVFLINGGGNDLAYDAVYSAVRLWSRYELVNTSEKADLVIEFHVGFLASGFGPVIPQFVLTITDARSKEPLWSTVDYRRRARSLKNGEKETIAAAQRLVNNWKERLGSN